MKQNKSTEISMRFAPIRVEGLPNVDEIAVYPDRLEVHSAGEWVTFLFVTIARWPRPVWMWKLLHRLGSHHAFLSVADRDWFDQRDGPYFAFYTRPRLVVYMPLGNPEDYHKSLFRKIQDVMEAGGFRSYDMG